MAEEQGPRPPGGQPALYSPEQVSSALKVGSPSQQSPPLAHS